MLQIRQGEEPKNHHLHEWPSTPTEGALRSIPPIPSTPLHMDGTGTDSEMSGVSIQISASHFSDVSCGPHCSCVCHSTRVLKTTSLLGQILGTLFVGYIGAPVLYRDCDNLSCNRKSGPILTVLYHFPYWFLARAIFFTASISPIPSILVRLHHVVSGEAEIFQLVRLGNFSGVKALLQQKQASPFDIDSGDAWSALHYAVNFRQPKIMKLLLQAGADPLMRNNDPFPK
jgi:hypothetical protein